MMKYCDRYFDAKAEYELDRVIAQSETNRKAALQSIDVLIRRHPRSPQLQISDIKWLRANCP